MTGTILVCVVVVAAALYLRRAIETNAEASVAAMDFMFNTLKEWRAKDGLGAKQSPDSLP